MVFPLSGQQAMRNRTPAPMPPTGPGPTLKLADPVGCQTARGGGENSPALQCWVGGGKAGRVPSGTAGRVLPSLRDFDLRSHGFPSAQALGYFQSRFVNQPDKQALKFDAGRE